MATIDFNGTDGVTLQSYDSNFTELYETGSNAQIYNPASEAEARMGGTFDRWCGNYTVGSSGDDQSAEISAKCEGTAAIINATSPMVMASSSGAYYFNYTITSGNAVSWQLRRFYSSFTNSDFLANITDSVSQTSFASIKLSAVVNGSGNVELSAVTDGTDHGLVYTDSSAGKLTTGYPGIQIYSDDSTTLGVESAIFTGGSGTPIPVFMNQHGQLNGGTI